MDYTGKELIENMIDSTDLSQVLEVISEICYEKGEHLRGNWQDIVAAKRWEKAAKRLDQANATIVKQWFS